MAEYSLPWDINNLGDGGPHTAEEWWRLKEALHCDSEELDERGPLAGRYNELAVGAPGGMFVSVQTGQAYAGGAWYWNDAILNLAIAAADPVNPRIDLVVITRNLATNTVYARVITGVAAPVPVPPAMTHTAAVWDIPLASVYVGAAVGAIVLGNITDLREFINPRQLLLGVSDFVPDPANPATLTVYAATDNRGWELTGGAADAVIATVHIPEQWGAAGFSLECRGYLWNYGAGGETINVTYRFYTSGDPAANLVAWAAYTNAGGVVDLTPLVTTITADAGQILEIRVGQGGAVSNWVLGMLLDFRRL